jgi:hypothetical protein
MFATFFIVALHHAVSLGGHVTKDRSPHRRACENPRQRDRRATSLRHGRNSMPYQDAANRRVFWNLGRSLADELRSHPWRRERSTNAAKLRPTYHIFVN